MTGIGYPLSKSLIAPLRYSTDHIVKALSLTKPSTLLLMVPGQLNSRVILSYEILVDISQAMGVREVKLYTLSSPDPLVILEIARLIEEHAPATLSLGGGTRTINILLYTAASLVPKSISDIILYEHGMGSLYVMPRWILSLASSNESRARLRILEIIAEKGEVRIAELANLTGYSKSTITKQVRWLSRAGLVKVSLGVAKALVEHGGLRLERASRR